MGGGLLRLRRAIVTQRLTGADPFTLSANIVQPSGPPLDPGTNHTSLTLLGANGQLFRATIPAEAMARRGNTWSFSNSRSAGLTALQFTSTDGLHYRVNARGRAPGLVAAMTPYVTVEVQVGNAVFSNAQTFRRRARQLVYP